MPQCCLLCKSGNFLCFTAPTQHFIYWHHDLESQQNLLSSDPNCQQVSKAFSSISLFQNMPWCCWQQNKWDLELPSSVNHTLQLPHCNFSHFSCTPHSDCSVSILAVPLCFLVGRHTCTEAKPYGRRVCTVGLSEALGELALPLLLQCAPIGWDSIFNYTVPRYFSVRLLPSLTTPQGWRRGIERSCCSPLKVHRNQRDCWKNILQVQVECCTGELNSVLYFAK